MLSIVASSLIVAAAIVVYLYVNRRRPRCSLRGKRVLVTGASSGVGEKLALEYARRGARLVVAARRESELQRVAKLCTELGAEQADYVVADFAKSEDRKRLVDETRRLLGGGLDHLVLVHILYKYGYWDGTEENIATLQTHLNVNVVSYADLASKCLDMLAESGGCVGVVSSVDGTIALPRTLTHTVSKFALQGFFSMWRQELQLKNIPVSVTVCILGAIATSYTRDFVSYFGMRAASVDETAEAIVQGIAERAVIVYHPVAAKIAVWAHKFFPRTVERYSYSCLVKLLDLA